MMIKKLVVIATADLSNTQQNYGEIRVYDYHGAKLPQGAKDSSYCKDQSNYTKN